jgi:hypothetical protein
MGGQDQFNENFSRWYDRWTERLEERKRRAARPKLEPPVPFALLATIGWMRGVVSFPDLEEYRCPEL